MRWVRMLAPAPPRWALAVALVAVSGLVGCGGSDEDNISLVRVDGTITKDGKPLPDARVVFAPDAGNKASTPGGDQTGPEGNYILRYKGRTGVAPGKYKVTVTPPSDQVDAKRAGEFKKDYIMIRNAQQAAGAARKAGGTETKKEVLKTEFDADVPETGATLNFDVKTLSAAGGAAK